MPHESNFVQVSNTSKHKPFRSLSAPVTTRQSLIEVTDTESKFPRIEECEHFHYDSVDYGKIKVALLEDTTDGLKINGSFNFEDCRPVFGVRITCQGNSCVVRRSLSHFQTLDKWLHECVYDRSFSQLPPIVESELITKTISIIQNRLRIYLQQLTSLTRGDISSGIACAPVLHWLEIDNHGRNLAPHALGDVADINIPAVAAARVVRRYQAQEDDDISLEVGDMVSIIEMGATGWWRGKQGLKVGSFPSQCVRRINSATDVIATHERPFSPPLHGVGSPSKPITRKHGKFMEFLRSFLDTRPSKAQLKRKGILRERVFGCDLGEFLHRSGDEIPLVVTDCTKFVEQHGIVDGIYRISGVASHIRFLRYEFDSDRRPDLEKDIVGLPNNAHVPGMSKNGNLICDPHSVAGLCKLYFRELPNPLLTYQLYDRFASAVTEYEAEERLLKVHDVIQQLPPPHYRTLKHLITHLRFMAQRDANTSMHCRNLAIVWAPNLLRSRDLEAGLAAFTEARVQSVVTEFLIVNGDLLFSDKLQTKQYDAEHKPPRPRSLMILPPPKLISLEEAQARSRGGMVAPASSDSLNISDLSTTATPRMRSQEGKSSSYERRKRGHKRGAGSSTLPHNYSSRVKKQGGVLHQYTDHLGSVEELRTPGEMSPTNKHFGWKTKLGSLLKKGHGNSVQRQASLRRCQSDDSLVSHGSQQKLSKVKRPLDFSKSSLTHAVSLEGPGMLEREFPEPQTSPVVLRHHTTVDGDKENKSRKRHSRPAGGIYSGKISPTKSGNHPFHPTFLPLKNKPTEPSNELIRSCSPFSGLASDFPSIMGERGLDFDPLNYRPSVLLKAKTPELVENNSDDNAMVTIKRVASEQSLTGEPMFAAISTVKQTSSQNKNNNQKIHQTRSKTSKLEELTSESIDFDNSGSKSARSVKKQSTFARDQLLKRISLKENVRSHRKQEIASHFKEKSIKNIDKLTADDCVFVSDNFKKQTKLSAAELLGVSPRKLSPDRENNLKSMKINKTKQTEKISNIYNEEGNSELPNNEDTNDLHLDLNENFKVLDLKDKETVTTLNKEASIDFTTSNKRYSVQCYSIPEDKGLQKKSHYGSFIALVGLKPDEKQSQNYNQSDQSSSKSHRKLNKTYSENYTTQPHSRKDFKQPHYPANQWRQPNVNQVYNNLSHQNSHNHNNHPNFLSENSNRFESNVKLDHQNYPMSQNSHSMKLVGYQCDKTYYDSEAGLTYKSSAHSCTVYTPKLDTFNPEGKQRQDYIDLTPPKPEFMNLFNSSSSRYENQQKLYHNRSQSVDSYPSHDTNNHQNLHDLPTHTAILPQRHHSVTTQHRNGTTYHPLPAPRKHGRSLSTGDDTDPHNVPEFARPIPLPRRLSRSSPHGPSYPPPSNSNSWSNSRRRLSDSSHPSQSHDQNHQYNSPNPPNTTSDTSNNFPMTSYDNPGTSYSNKTYEYVENVEPYFDKPNYYHEQQHSYPPRRKLFHQNQLERRVLNRDFGENNSQRQQHFDDVTRPHDVIRPTRDNINPPHSSVHPPRDTIRPFCDVSSPARDVIHHSYDVTPRKKQQRASYAEGMLFNRQQNTNNSNYSRASIASLNYYQHETYAPPISHVTPAQDFPVNQAQSACSSLSWV